MQAPAASRRKRLIHWVLKSPLLGRSALILAGFALLLAIFSLAAAAGNTRAWAENYNTFLFVNLILSAALGTLVLGLMARLLWRLKQQKFGARLTLKFAGAFATLALLPGVLVYLVSILFLHQSIEGWFNVRVNTALQAGIELSRAAMDGLLQDLTLRARNAAASVDVSDERTALVVQAERIYANQLASNPASAVLFFDGAGQVLASAGVAMSKGLVYDTPHNHTNAMQVLKRTGVFSQLEAQPNAAGEAEGERLSLRVVVAVPKNQLASKTVAKSSSSSSSSSSATPSIKTGSLGLKMSPNGSLKPIVDAATTEPNLNPAQGLTAGLAGSG